MPLKPSEWPLSLHKWAFRVFKTPSLEPSEPGGFEASRDFHVLRSRKCPPSTFCPIHKECRHMVLIIYLYLYLSRSGRFPMEPSLFATASCGMRAISPYHSLLVPPLDGQNRQSPIASVQRARSTLASHTAVPRGTNAKRMNANRAIRIAAKRTRGFAKGVSRTVSPRVFLKMGRKREKKKHGRKRKITEENGKIGSDSVPATPFAKSRRTQGLEAPRCLCFRERYDCRRTLAIRIAAITLASDSAITIARFRPSKVPPWGCYCSLLATRNCH